MKHIQKFLLVLIAASFCLAAAAATSAAGTWKGKIIVNWAKMSAQIPPQQLAAIKKRYDSLVITIILKSNKTFVATGSPQGKQTGRWTQSGNVVSLISPKAPTKPQKFQLSKNGKVLSIDFAGRAKLVLNRFKPKK